MYTLRNQHAIDTPANVGNHSHNFPWTIRKIMIINDSSGVDMSFSFQESAAKAVLHPSETITIDIHTKKIFIDGNAEHRIWVWG